MVKSRMYLAVLTLDVTDRNVSVTTERASEHTGTQLVSVSEAHSPPVCFCSVRWSLIVWKFSSDLCPQCANPTSLPEPNHVLLQLQTIPPFP